MHKHDVRPGSDETGMMSLQVFEPASKNLVGAQPFNSNPILPAVNSNALRPLRMQSSSLANDLCSSFLVSEPFLVHELTSDPILRFGAAYRDVIADPLSLAQVQVQNMNRHTACITGSMVLMRAFQS